MIEHALRRTAQSRSIWADMLNAAADELEVMRGKLETYENVEAAETTGIIEGAGVPPMNSSRGGPDGFRRIEFADAEGAECRLWESAGATEPACPLAPDVILWPAGRFAILDRARARWLAERLAEFAATGRLPAVYEEPGP